MNTISVDLARQLAADRADRLRRSRTRRSGGGRFGRTPPRHPAVTAPGPDAA